ncbi:hypothetical protein BTO20_37455 (plasmid) [Mycobacterium dioxanotrophicus]|uniref:Uncharacterized protein n=1 Tax=Mycobacterium dioxanotrophicus TaxID=482462 RepID=A0A1Y0CH95_9MYCO|nr:hypothetical protein BTO20_37455 [Mycobacterium dioxanotrophicus]
MTEIIQWCQVRRQQEEAVFAHCLAEDLRRLSAAELYPLGGDSALDPVQRHEQTAVAMLDAVYDWYTQTVLRTPPWAAPLAAPQDAAGLAKLAALSTDEFDNAVENCAPSEELDAIEIAVANVVGRHRLPSLIRSHHAENRSWKAIARAH